MSTYVIGDIQGCFDSLLALLKRVDYRPGEDRLWLVGDLVNRGPRSLEVVEWAMSQPNLVTVLGNHDLHLLAILTGVTSPKKKDTLEALCASPRRDEIARWLRQQPLAFAERQALMVHAGLNPTWSVSEAIDRAHRVSQYLRQTDKPEVLTRKASKAKTLKRAHKELATDLGWLTRVRCVDAVGDSDESHKGTLEDVPEGLTPWFVRGRWPEHMIYFGHWSAIGVQRGEGYVALDTGCVWGRSLTALCIETNEVFSVEGVEGMHHA